MKNSKLNFAWVILCCITVLNVLLYNEAKAQLWSQLGEGAGGQVRAVYLYNNPLTSSYDVYAGSDVAGVWKATGIPFNGLGTLANYSYKYISQFEIVRFINKFYQPTGYASNYLFVGNDRGIKRIDLTGASSMQSVLLLKDSWVSDIFVSAGYLAGGDHMIYFTTGNTRVSDDVAGNAKDGGIFDFYWGHLNMAETNVTINPMGTLYGHINLLNLSGDHDVFCLYVDEKVSK